MMMSEERMSQLAAGADAFGRWLAYERELRGLARDEVVRLARLPAAAIDALESGDADRVPRGAYAFGHLRAYAAAVGLDADDVVLRWQEVVGPEDVAPARPRARSVLRPLLAIVAALALGALAVLALVGPGRQRAPLKLDRPRAVERAPYSINVGR